MPHHPDIGIATDGNHATAIVRSYAACGNTANSIDHHT